MSRISVGDRREKFFFIFGRTYLGTAGSLVQRHGGMCEAMHLVREIRLDLRYTLPQWYGYAD